MKDDDEQRAVSYEESKRIELEKQNARFLALLRLHHPKGPPTYCVKQGVPVISRVVDGRCGSPAGMCADAI
jgi:hypothetical protein